MNIFTEIENFITSNVWPFLKNVGKSVVKAETIALQPIAEQLVADAAQTVIQAALSGSTSQVGAALGKLIADTAAQAEQAGIKAGVTALAASVGAALASNSLTATNLAPIAPAPVVEPAPATPAADPAPAAAETPAVPVAESASGS